jgi:lipoprotein NlpD
VRKYCFVVACGIILSGCAEQQPANVVSLQPTTYRVAALQKVPAQANNRVITENAELKWMWPTKGNVLSKFSASNQTFKGIDISGREGAPVVAAGDGEVVYSGNSLRGYGNLIIIKHKKNFLTAYAHNRKNMVKEGERVVIGQRIAEMGQTGTNRVKLHFEVRYQGKPIDPQGILPLNK